MSASKSPETMARRMVERAFLNKVHAKHSLAANEGPHAGQAHVRFQFLTPDGASVTWGAFGNDAWTNFLDGKVKPLIRAKLTRALAEINGGSTVANLERARQDVWRLETGAMTVDQVIPVRSGNLTARAVSMAQALILFGTNPQAPAGEP